MAHSRRLSGFDSALRRSPGTIATQPTVSGMPARLAPSGRLTRITQGVSAPPN